MKSDQGKEFLNSQVKQLFANNGINFFTSTDDVIKCAIVERFNRTLRTRIYRYLHYYNTRRYIDDLQKIVKSYNNSYHRTIQMSPSQ
uniref:Integrase catalytic domain-containing protein n=1 Tax=Tetranychus urticae TaxID=32264 RepID=A0A158P5N7_TETUR